MGYVSRHPRRATGLAVRDLDGPTGLVGTGGPTISLTIHRIPAQDPAHRIGALLVNPGGPGGSATRLVDQFSFLYSQELRQRFDLVGMDPRGIALSTPVSCDYSRAEQSMTFSLTARPSSTRRSRRTDVRADLP